jgi:hypothetical protein
MLVFNILEGRTETIDFAALPIASQEFVVNYGLKQLLADSHVSGKTLEEKEGLLDKKLDKLFEGTLAIRSSGPRDGDPVAKELTKLATAKVHAHIKTKLKLKVADVDKEDMAALMAKARAMPALIAQAEANVAALAGIEVEL